jgi:hypothetical protein
MASFGAIGTWVPTWPLWALSHRPVERIELAWHGKEKPFPTAEAEYGRATACCPRLLYTVGFQTGDSRVTE